ncbi:uncharacterized protein Dwil_GK23872 [Drosophila willistoni]|uniref:MD-2-related lipid-recognition domain-containing protein n=1 Tax=Drosophila willistoni TaxID=7260 RepID=B4MTM7_DROWI|nr:uncharacterized protein LOC6641726 [Drosophila willistoni]EDW75466.2 uncharacterized protein Dwil_GK23872 [Drosophila willistoni]
MKFEFTNLKYENFDKEFCEFEYCYLKSINRTYKYLSLRVNLLQLPVTKFSVRFQMLKRFNGYKPFLYDTTVDGCKFLANQKINPVAGFFFGLFSKYSNINHTCPYEHDVIVDKVAVNTMNNGLTNVLPFPEGDYLYNITWIAYGKPRAVVKVFGTLS